MGNIYSNAIPIFFSYKVKFTRDIPQDFYISGDRAKGIIELTTNETINLYIKYGLLHVELIGEIHYFKTHKNAKAPNGIQIFFWRKVKLIQLPKTNQQNKSLQIHRWAFDALLDSFLSSSLPPKDESKQLFNTKKFVFSLHSFANANPSKKNPPFQYSVKGNSVKLH
ncbi:unnamed protein product [Adineta ricciae]|uniref:Uncharacterized protein n=1 Tax=Adineta ricciae TaxID=249248 RepID=A0A815WMV3_ADIRI|nr:unnamed protein product [Adineta ricciae]CAF1549800.1 unnamed protein product [Adineta ricciae]